MTDFDTWFFRQASYENDFWEEFCPDNEPKLIKDDYYNCTVCDNNECEYWHEYNS